MSNLYEIKKPTLLLAKKCRSISIEDCKCTPPFSKQQMWVIVEPKIC
jgi:hypothetical protein